MLALMGLTTTTFPPNFSIAVAASLCRFACFIFTPSQLHGIAQSVTNMSSVRRLNWSHRRLGFSTSMPVSISRRVAAVDRPPSRRPPAKHGGRPHAHGDRRGPVGRWYPAFRWCYAKAAVVAAMSGESAVGVDTVYYVAAAICDAGRPVAGLGG